MRGLITVFLVAALSLPALARDLIWQSLDSLQGGDKLLAQQTLYDFFGDDPGLWPDWIHPMALYIPYDGDRLLIVRRPLHAPCGDYGFAVLGPVNVALSRDRIGDFCGGGVTVIALADRGTPDLQIEDGQKQDDQGNWLPAQQRLRWRDGQWWLVTP